MSVISLKSVKRFFVWMLALLALLVLCAVLFIWYQVESFDTQTLPARYGQVDSKLYLGTSDANAAQPLIVGLGGAEGGNSWTSGRWGKQRARFQAQGYALLALGYFGLPNTPENLDRIALEGVFAAIKAAQANPRVSKSCIIVLGGSKGSELALALASHYPEIDAVIGLMPADTVFPAHTQAMNTSSWAMDGKPLTFVPMPWSATWDFIKGDIGKVMNTMLAQTSLAQAAAISVEKVNGPILLISATRDEMWPSTMMSERAIQRLASAGFRYTAEHIPIEGDHGEPLNHLDQVESFLHKIVREKPECAVQ
jgi:pimeloyl-ACP methyl ester carboxylesterase